METEINNILPFKVAPKKSMYSSINLTNRIFTLKLANLWSEKSKIT